MRAALLASGLLLGVAVAGCQSPSLGEPDGGVGDASVDRSGDARDGSADAFDARADRCGDSLIIERIDASCSLGYESPPSPPVIGLTMVKDVDTTVADSVVRVFVDDKGALLVAGQHLVRVARDGTTTIIENPTGVMSLDAAQGVASYGIVVSSEAVGRLCVIRDDTWPDPETCPSLSTSASYWQLVRWDGAAYWTFGTTTSSGPARRVATYDETGALLEEHLGPVQDDGFLAPQLLGSQIVDFAYARPEGECDTMLADVRPRSLDAQPVRTALLPTDFKPDSVLVRSDLLLAASPTRALLVYGGRCWDWVAGAPLCRDWNHLAPAAVLATVLGTDGTPVVVGQRLPDLPIVALRWDGKRFVALLRIEPEPCCQCEQGPPPGGPLGLAIFDEGGNVVSVGSAQYAYPEVWIGDPRADVALDPGVGYVVAYSPYASTPLHVALVTGQPP